MTAELYLKQTAKQCDSLRAKWTSDGRFMNLPSTISCFVRRRSIARISF